MEHGTVSAYAHHGCRCPECKKASREKAARLRKERLSRTEKNGWVAPVEKHNASTASNWGCRCPACKAALAAVNKANENRWPETRKRTQKRIVSKYQETSSREAKRTRQQWTTTELELADRSDLTARDIAKVTGRTMYAVARMRSRIATGDPRLDNAIGKVKK